MKNKNITSTTEEYLNATELCEKYNRTFGGYYGREETKALIEELAKEMRKPENIIIQAVKNENTGKTEVWIHPALALNFVQWISPKLAAKTNMKYETNIAKAIHKMAQAMPEKKAQNKEIVPADISDFDKAIRKILNYVPEKNKKD